MKQAYCLLTAYYRLPTTDCLLPTAYYLLYRLTVGVEEGVQDSLRLGGAVAAQVEHDARAGEEGLQKLDPLLPNLKPRREVRIL